MVHVYMAGQMPWLGTTPNVPQAIRRTTAAEAPGHVRLQDADAVPRGRGQLLCVGGGDLHGRGEDVGQDQPVARPAVAEGEPDGAAAAAELQQRRPPPATGAGVGAGAQR